MCFVPPVTVPKGGRGGREGEGGRGGREGEGGRGEGRGREGREEGNPGRLDNFFSCKHLVAPIRDERTQQKMRAKTVRERNHCSVLPVFFPMCVCLSMYTPFF